MKLYTCESCGYLVCAKKVPKKCPNCRSRLLEKGKSKKDLVKVKCPACEETFYYDPKKGKPFKCAFCDRTFAETNYV